MSDQIKLLAAELRESLAGLDATQTQATPLRQPDRWSIQQIVEHLILSYGSTAKVLRTRLEKGRPTHAGPSFAQRVGQFMIIRLGRFPSGRKAPQAVTPSATSEALAGVQLQQHVDEHLDELERLLATGQEAFGSRRAASHLVLGPLSMEQWRSFHLVHGRHHLKQIAAIRKAHHY